MFLHLPRFLSWSKSEGRVDRCVDGWTSLGLNDVSPPTQRFLSCKSVFLDALKMFHSPRMIF